MLIAFKVSNFKSFKEETIFSLLANHDKESLIDSNVFEAPFNLTLLKSGVIYGGNASGKTKFFEALQFMLQFVSNSSKEGQIDELIGVDPFRLSSTTEKEASVFEIQFIHDGQLFRYGFEADRSSIKEEWLFHRPKTKEVELFYRTEQNFDIHTKFKVNDLIKNNRVRPNALLLSVAANWNDSIAIQVLEWMRQVNIISGIGNEGYLGFSIAQLNQEENKQNIISFLKSADIGIEDVQLNPLHSTNLPKKVSNKIKDRVLNEEKEGKEALIDLSTFHKKYNDKNQAVDLTRFSMSTDESYGTQKYFSLSGPILDTLQNGRILFVDELANALHPNLIESLVRLFNSEKHNPKNAQLVFTTHNTNLLSANLFRRDQIWFVDKDRYGASSLFSLADFKSNTVRKTDNFEKNYLKGRYGGLPHIVDEFQVSTSNQ